MIRFGQWKKTSLWILPVLIAGVLVRLLNWSAVYVDGQFYLPVVDGMYHLRVVELMLTGNWNWAFLDPWLAYPTGAIPYWPPGFDGLLSLLAFPVYKLTGDMAAVMEWLGWLMPLLGALVALLVVRAVRQVNDRTSVTVFAGMAAVLEWGLVRPGQLGVLDHHGLSLVVMGILIWLMLGPVSRMRDRWIGILLGVVPLLFPDALIFPILISGCFAFQLLMEATEEALTSWRRVTGWALVAAIPTILFTGYFWTVPVSMVYPGMLHLLFYLVNWLLPLSLFLLMEQGLPLRSALLILLTIVAVIAVTTGGELAGILFRQEPNAMVVGESRPLLQFYEPAHFLFRPLYWMLPVALAGMAWRMIRYRDGFARMLFPLTGATMVLTLLQVRFEPLLAISGLTAGVILLGECWEAVRGRRLVRNLLFGVIVLMITIQGAFLFAGWRFYTEMKGVPRFVRLDRAMEAVTNITDPAGDITNLDVQPPWGILAPRWHQGHHVLFKGRRAVVATPFGGVAPFVDRIEDALDVLTARNEAEVLAVCRRVQARYLLVQASAGKAFDQYLKAANASRERLGLNWIDMTADDSWINQLCVDAVEPAALELLWQEPADPNLPEAERLRLYEVHQVVHLPEIGE